MQQKWYSNLYVLTVYRLLLILLLFTISRILFYSFNTDLFPHMTIGHFVDLMGAGIKFDLSATMYVNALYILCQTIPFRFRYRLSYQKALKWLFCITNAIVFFPNCADSAYFRFTFRRTTVASLKQFVNDAVNTDLIWRFFLDYWWVIIVWAALVLIMVFAYGRLQVNKPAIRHKVAHYAVAFLLMVLSLGCVVIGIRGNINDFPIAMNHAGEKVNSPVETGIVLNTPFCIIRAANQQNINVYDYYPEDKLPLVYSPIHHPQSNGFHQKNVVIIILEGFGKENIGFFNAHLDHGSYRGYAPFLDSLLNESLTFTRSFSNGVSSNDAITSVLSSIPGLMPITYVSTIYANNRINGLAELLSSKGYDCSFFHGAPNGSMRFLEFTRIAGFEHYYGQEAYANEDGYDGHWGIWDEPFFQYMATTLSTKKEPFLATLFTLTSHHPFRIPEKYKDKFPEGELPIHKTISYTDYALRRFFETASTMPWFDHTLFVITADHTNGAVHDEYKTSVGRFSVPILFYEPGGSLKEVDSVCIVQHIDIMPSVLDYLGYDAPYFAYGQSIFSEKIDRLFAINRMDETFQIFQDHYVLQELDNQSTALFDYKADSLLQNDIRTTYPQVAHHLDSLYKAVIQQYNNRIVSNKTTL